MDSVNFSGWRPIRFYIAKGQVMVDWIRLLDEPLREPFFQHGIQSQMQRPFHLAFRRQTPLSDSRTFRGCSRKRLGGERELTERSEQDR